MSDEIPVGGDPRLTDADRQRLRDEAARARASGGIMRGPPVGSFETTREALQPPGFIVEAAQAAAPLNPIVVPSNLLERSGTCPFSGRSLGDPLVDVASGTIRVRGYAWTSRPFRSIDELRQTLGMWYGMSEPTPATRYLYMDPWTGERLEPVKLSAGWQYRGKAWSSSIFKSQENAFHWFSIRLGRAPLFGPNSLLILREALNHEPDDGEALHLKELKANQEQAEYMTEEFNRRGIFAKPGRSLFDLGRGKARGTK